MPLTTNESDFVMATPENTKLIPLMQGKFAIVDAEDYDFLMRWKWHYSHGYVVRTMRIGDRKYNRTIKIIMHRAIMKIGNGEILDHINGNGLDNRRCNLRICTRVQNMRNRKLQKGSSRYKGVSWCEKLKKWCASIKYTDKKSYLGCFKHEQDAALAYNVAAKKYFGEFARINEFL